MRWFLASLPRFFVTNSCILKFLKSYRVIFTLSRHTITQKYRRELSIQTFFCKILLIILYTLLLCEKIFSSLSLILNITRCSLTVVDFCIGWRNREWKWQRQNVKFSTKQRCTCEFFTIFGKFEEIAINIWFNKSRKIDFNCCAGFCNFHLTKFLNGIFPESSRKMTKNRKTYISCEVLRDESCQMIKVSTRNF